ncbi:carbamoyl-phosphate synthase large subunit [Nakamurella panacisegetis]|uniref:Carbamoyl-phosphate synthase large subunit n=1 Tax=Nakamurella panacisegetis TaxID=1090615 RepID=A0A1H0S5I8_9ACTN|nr:ATP-grasp domain-containing protein [Nakamurella panacisegetis]SDP37012.1 carbamoyl-phosphate synthase large subunit [Nakamurella panacisegetis]
MITGTGGPAGIAVLRSLSKRGDVQIVSADMDRLASGLYMVEPSCRRLVPPGLDPAFVDTLLDMCRADDIDVLFPTVDVELLPLARRRAEFAAIGTVIASPQVETLEVCLDKYELALRCSALVPTPRTDLLGPGAAVGRSYPVIVKPRRGAGSRGVHLVASEAELLALGTDDDRIVQDYLPGAEFSVDVVCGLDGHVIAAVPRSRLRIDSGVAVAGETVHDEDIEQTARRVAVAVGMTTVANVQLRLDAAGTASLLEVNPRFPGSLPLTIAAGVDMPSLTLDMMVGINVPRALDFSEVAVVRYLEDIFLRPAEISVDAHTSGLAVASTASEQ